jgi:SAM-dependent methyltransferase
MRQKLTDAARAVVPLRVRQLLYQAWYRVMLRGSGVVCVLCGSEWRAFGPLGGGPNRQCPRCFSLERHRLLWLYLERERGELFATDNRVLHIAPEQSLQKRLRALPRLDYLSGDLDSRLADVRLDVTDLSFPDASFDVVICNHVLEHVLDDRRAMSELYRVLRPGGWGVAMVPDVEKETTFEDPTAVTPEQRLALFGQADHVRRYGRDYVQRLESVGFRVSVEELEDALDPDEQRRLGLRKFGRIEPIFIVSKDA